MKVKCDRCGNLVDGYEWDGATSGFYGVTQKPWKKYQRPGESRVCEPCMWASEEYRRDYPTVDPCDDATQSIQHVNARKG